MSIAWTIFTAAYILALGYLAAHKLIPFVVVRIGRLLGFKMQLSPIWAKRIGRFKRIRRGFYAFRIITTLYLLSFFLEFMINNRPVLISFDGKMAAPAFKEWLGTLLVFEKLQPTFFNKKDDFGQIGEDEVDYRLFKKYSSDPSTYRTDIEEMKADLEKKEKELASKPAPKKEDSYYEWEKHQEALKGIERGKRDIATHEGNFKVFEGGGAFCIMPVYPYSWGEFLLLDERPPNPPDLTHPLGTDTAGLDVLPQLAYGFRIALTFALIVASIGYSIGVIVGGVMGYYSGWTDIIVQRVIEIWGSIPFLFTIMILTSIVKPGFILLCILLVVLRSWMGITYTIRGEFYREKARDYVQAAIAMGASDWKVMTRHILPNALVPIVSFAPFGIVAYIGTLVSLDYLGFGLRVGTPSWGGLLQQGMKNVLHHPHLILIPSIANAATLFCVVMIGEAVREAFDPKVFSRLR